MSHRILVVTDHAALGDVLMDRFQAMGHMALLTPPDLIAQRVAQWGQPEIILWDLPRATGGVPDPGPAFAVRKSLPQPPPLLLLLPEGVGGDMPSGEAVLVLKRPVDFETLADAIDQLLEERGAAAATPATGKAESRPEVAPIPAEVSMLEAGRAVIDRQGVRVRNLDLGGARFESPVDYPPGTGILLRLKVPGETVPLRLPADVRWSRRDSDHAMVECRFRPIPSHDLGRLERLLAARAQPS